MLNASRTTCATHPNVRLICPACVGAVTSAAKADASRKNGKLGGRPKGSTKKPPSTPGRIA
jgi:hypothetical protein